jgi:hypothetical protein
MSDMPSSFAELLRGLQDPPADPPVPPDPDTMDVGESRPVTLQEALWVEEIRAMAEPSAKIRAITALLHVRSGETVKHEQLAIMPLEDFHRAVSRMMADLMPKLEKAQHLASMLNLFRQTPPNGSGH